jgi:hypothetical protein
MSLDSILSRLQLRRPARRAKHHYALRQLRFETFEDRRMLSFTPAVSFPVGASPLAVVTGDFNGDGHLDLATGNLLSETQDQSVTVSVLLGDGSGSFGTADNSYLGTILYANDPYWAAFSLTAADFNNDGNDDLAFAVRNTQTFEAGGAGVLLSKGDGTFRAATYIPANGSIDTVASGDFNNDGNSDLAVTGLAASTGEFYAYAQVLIGNGRGGFAPSPYATTWGWSADQFHDLAVGDLNGDGKLDAVGVSEYYGDGVALLGNGGGGAFYDSHWFSTTSNRSVDVAVGDFSDDGIPDLVTAGGTLEFHIGHGDGTFDAPTAYSTNANEHTGVAVADFNGDGKLDAVVSEGDTGTVSLLLGNGDGTFSTAENVAVRAGANAAVTDGDFNLDGAVNGADLLVWQQQLGQSGAGLAADGDGNGEIDGGDYDVWKAKFGESTAPGTVPRPVAVVIGDFNGDGQPDVATANAGSNNVSVLLNNNQTSASVPAKISVSDVTVTEGNTGAVNVMFTVTLSNRTNVDVTVRYDTANGTAMAGNDYIAKTGTLTFNPGETTKTITIEVKADNKKESDETFYLDLINNSSNSSFAKFRGIGTIRNDD